MKTLPGSFFCYETYAAIARRSNPIHHTKSRNIITSIYLSILQKRSKKIVNVLFLLFNKQDATLLSVQNGFFCHNFLFTNVAIYPVRLSFA